MPRYAGPSVDQIERFFARNSLIAAQCCKTSIHIARDDRSCTRAAKLRLKHAHPHTAINKFDMTTFQHVKNALYRGSGSHG